MATLRSACRPASGSQGCARSLDEKRTRPAQRAVRYRSRMAVITPTGHACGAVVTDLDARAINDAEAAELRSALDEHHVLVFPDQRMSNDELERFSEAFGRLGTDPWFIRSRAAITSPRSGATPMKRHRCSERAGIPTGAFSTPRRWRPVCSASPSHGRWRHIFANQHLAYDHLSDDLKSRLEGLSREAFRPLHLRQGQHARPGVGRDGRTDDGDPRRPRPL